MVSDSHCAGVVVNQDAWNELPDDLKEVIIQASRATTAYMSSWFEYGNIKATKDFLAAGTQITHLDDDSMKKISTIISEVLAEEAEKNPDFKKILSSQIKFMKDFAPVRNYESPFTFGTNSVSLPELK
jgi:TRAP-type mannitol/chloroaromatic compound transport system substrate-binding protein